MRLGRASSIRCITSPPGAHWRDAPADGPLKAFLTDLVDGRRRGLRGRRGVLGGEGNGPTQLAV